MAGRGKLIAVIGDEDTVTGFLLGGIGELNKNRHPNFLVVEKDTTINEIEDTFRYGSLRGLNGTFSCLVGARGEGGGGPGLPDLGRSVRPRPRGSRKSVHLPFRRGGLRVPSSLLGLGGTGAMSGPQTPPCHMTVCQERRGTELVTGGRQPLGQAWPARAERPEGPGPEGASLSSPAGAPTFHP